MALDFLERFLGLCASLFLGHPTNAAEKGLLFLLSESLEFLCWPSTEPPAQLINFYSATSAFECALVF